MSGKNVLVVDNDPQFNATSALVSPQLYIDKVIKGNDFLSIYNIYEKPPRLRGTKATKLDPQKFFMTLWYMGKHEFFLDLIPSRIDLFETLRNPTSKEYLLDHFLQQHAGKYEYILIDCPPTPSVLTTSAFAASDFVIIPVTADYYGTMGLPQFLGTLNDFKSDLPDRHNITPLGVVFTNVPRTDSPDIVRSMTRVTEALRELPDKIYVFSSKMSHFQVYQKSLWMSMPVQHITGRGTRGKSQAVAELGHIAKEFEGEVHKRKRKDSNGK